MSSTSLAIARMRECFGQQNHVKHLQPREFLLDCKFSGLHMSLSAALIMLHQECKTPPYLKAHFNIPI